MESNPEPKTLWIFDDASGIDNPHPWTGKRISAVPNPTEVNWFAVAAARRKAEKEKRRSK